MSTPETILIVDDEPDNLTVTKKVIQMSLPDVEIATFQDPESVMDFLRVSTISVIILDVQMPGINGIELCRRIKSSNQTRHIPVILVTSHSAFPTVKAEGLDAGAEDFLTRPTDNVELVARVKVALRINRAESELRCRANQAQHDYKQLFDKMLSGFAVHEMIYDAEDNPVDYRFLSVNPAFEILTTLRANDIIGKTVLEVLPGIRPQWLEKYGRVVATGEPIAFEDYSGPLDRHFEVAAFRVGKNQFATSFTDITDRKRVDKEIKRAADIVANIQVGLYIYQLENVDDDTSLRMITINDAAAKITGLSARNVIGKTLDESFPGLREMGVPQAYAEVVRSGQPRELGEICYGDERVSSAIFSVRAFPLPDNCVGVAFDDVTEQKRAEERLRKLNAAVEQSPISIVMTDPQGAIEYVNPKFYQLTGYTAEEVMGENPRFLQSGDTPTETYERLWETILAGGEWRGVFHNKKKNGELYWEDALISPILNEQGEITGFLAVKEDITHRIKMEEQLQQAEKMEAIGHLAGGIAHDFNNILGGIVGYAEMTMDIAPQGSPIEHNLKQILKAGDRATSLVRQILSFSRQNKETKAPLHLKPIIDEAVQLLRASLPSSIEIKCSLARDTKPVLVDPTKIHEIVMNLSTNASDAMTDKGILEIMCSEAHVASEMDGQLGTIFPGFYSIIAIKDSGHGINKSVLPHVFEPFYTTKEVGKGTGMGLSVVFGVVQSHGGNIIVDSNPGEGTTFQIYLPKTDQTLIGDYDKGTILKGGDESILFVDDERELNEMTTTMLSDLGYKVSAFPDSVKALRAFEEAADSFDLVITDQTMPAMSGMELSKELIRIRNDIPIILCTGFSKTVNDKDAIAAGIKGYCMKPLRKKDLAYKIRTILDGRSD
ncbi:MAG: response regulator [Deltaproteobacteria bacterium]|nr:response regulator [Deltaproteobacteria bacterium]